MQVEKTGHGFEIITHGRYTEIHDKIRLVQQSSVVGDYEDSMERPGTSFLWVGSEHHLNREEVAELAERLSTWAKTGSLSISGEP